jgi:hypothetical protein
MEGNQVRHEGVVFKVYEKEFSGKMTYSIKLDGQPLYHRAKFNRYAGIAEPGNRIAFDADDNPDKKSTTITSPVVLVAATPVAASGAPSAGGGGWGAERNNSIVYQSSRKDAIAFLQIVLGAGSLKLPAALNAKLGALEAALDRYTALFFDDVNTLGAVLREAEGEKEEKPAKAVEADEEE